MIQSVSKAPAGDLIRQEWRPFLCLMPNLHQKLLTNKQKCHPSTLLNYFPCRMWVLQLCMYVKLYLNVNVLRRQKQHLISIRRQLV